MLPPSLTAVFVLEGQTARSAATDWAARWCETPVHEQDPEKPVEIRIINLLRINYHETLYKVKQNGLFLKEKAAFDRLSFNKEQLKQELHAFLIQWIQSNISLARREKDLIAFYSQKDMGENPTSSQKPWFGRVL